MFRYIGIVAAVLAVTTSAIAKEVAVYRGSSDLHTDLRFKKPQCEGGHNNIEEGVYLLDWPDGCDKLTSLIKVTNPNRGTCTTPDITGGALPVVIGLDPRSGVYASVTVINADGEPAPCLPFGDAWVKLGVTDGRVVVKGTVYETSATWNVDALWVEGTKMPMKALNADTNFVFDLLQGRQCRPQPMTGTMDLHYEPKAPGNHFWITLGQSCL
ncbi:MAG: hypothetical protein WC802_02935 [Patescibacteria group bacterium]|jgi:hypothetical protein